MHEYSIVQALIARVDTEARAHRASRVRQVHVSIGELSGVEVDLLATAFRLFRERTICQDAELDVRPVEARWTCTRCDRPIARGAILQCPECGGRASLAGGDEIVLDRIEMEVP